MWNSLQRYIIIFLPGNIYTNIKCTLWKKTLFILFNKSMIKNKLVALLSLRVKK